MAQKALQAEIIWEEGLRFRGQTASGHEIILDADASHGGSNAGPRPVELLLIANAACTGMDVISILQKMRQPVEGYRLRITGERREEHPRIFTKIVIEHIVKGDIEEEKLAHAVQLSDEKYCSVSAMLRGVAQIEARWAIER